MNITKHVLKPKHEVLTAEEKAKLLKEYNVVDSQVCYSIICWSYFMMISYCFIILELEVMVPCEFCSLLLLRLVENNNAAWCLLLVVAFHHTC